MSTPAFPLRSLIVLGLALPAWYGSLATGDAARAIVGPLAVATGSDSVFVAAPGKLYRLDPEGKLLSTLDGVIDAATRDAGLAVAADGSLLAAPASDGALLRCAADGTACAPFTTDDYAPRGAVQLYSYEDWVWISETRSDRILRYRSGGERVDMPVSIGIDAPGTALQVGETLYLADSNNHRVVRYELAKRGIGEAEALLKVPGDDGLPDRPLRLLPREDGFWLLLDDAERRRGQLATLDGDGTLTRLDAKGLVRPTSIAALGTDLLLVDEGSMQVLQRSADGTLTPFGDAAWRAQLAGQASLRDALRLASPLLLALAALLAAVGGALLLRELLPRLTAGMSGAVAKPDADGITWLANTAAEARRRLPVEALAALPPALFPALALAHFGFAAAAVGWAVVVVGGWAAWLQQRAQQLQPPKGLAIGIRRDRLVIADAEAGQREFPLANVAWSDAQLDPAPGVSVPLIVSGKPLFAQQDLQQALFPKLDPKKRRAG